MKKMDKEAVLALQLESFGIRPLTLWVTRPERDMAKQLRRVRAREDLVLESVMEKELEKTRERCQTEIDSRPKTVGDLIEKYKYRFTTRSNRGHGSRYQVGLGSKPIAELKKELTELGLTPDDWPALVPSHGELIDHLSKESIKKLPILEIWNQPAYLIKGYMSCKEEEVPSKTVGDLIKINPFTPDREYSAERFFKHHKRFLFTLRQKLHQKGFTVRDGAFLKWNPVPDTSEKVCKILRKYRLSESDVQRFADIIIAERWVI